MGRIVSFYSYKGGVGRSMALANIGALLSRWGHRVLLVDWDLEAPGLESFFADYLSLHASRQTTGLVEFLSAGFEREAIAAGADWAKATLRVSIPDYGDTLSLITAGKRDSEYFQKVKKLDFHEFYARKEGGAFVESLRGMWKEQFDFVLVDSRTGITDIGGICTVQVPDILVLLCTATKQSLDGIVEVAANAAKARQQLPFERLSVPAIPVVGKFDMQKEFAISEEWLRRFARGLKPIYANWLPRSIDRQRIIRNTKLPYVPYFSFGEKLPVLEQGTSEPTGLGYAYENLAALIANDLESIEELFSNREAFVRAAQRQHDLWLAHDQADTEAVRDFAELLRRKGFRPVVDEPQAEAASSSTDIADVVSQEAPCLAVCLGGRPFRRWATPDVRARIDSFLRRDKEVVCIVLPHAPEELTLESPLVDRTSFDLRSGMGEEDFVRLRRAIGRARLGAEVVVPGYVPEPGLYISHPHQYKAFADVLANTVTAWSNGAIRVYQTSDAGRSPLTLGDTIRGQLEETLRNATVFFLLYLDAKSAVYCMWEAGVAVATRGESLGTRLVVFQLGRETPSVFGEDLLVTHTAESILKFTIDLHRSDSFFPSLGSALAPSLGDDVLRKRAQALFDEMVRTQKELGLEAPAPTETFARWIVFTVSLSQDHADAIYRAANPEDESDMDDGTALQLAMVRGREIVEKHCVVEEYPFHLLAHFGMSEVPKGTRLVTLYHRWKISLRHNKSEYLRFDWWGEICTQITLAISLYSAREIQVPLKSVREEETWYLPVIMEKIINPTQEKVLFKVALIRVPESGEFVNVKTT